MSRNSKKPWWNKLYGKDCICPITRTRLRPGRNKYGQKRSVFLKCKHGFERQALEDWVHTNISMGIMPTCPMCRSKFDISIVFKANIDNIDHNKCTVVIID